MGQNKPLAKLIARAMVEVELSNPARYEWLTNARYAVSRGWTPPEYAALLAFLCKIVKKRRRLTIRGLGEMVGVQMNAIHQWTSGQNRPMIEHWSSLEAVMVREMGLA